MLSTESKRVLNYAAEEADRLSDRHVGTEHLLLGLLREEKCLASQVLGGRGLKLSAVREELARKPQQSAPQFSLKSTVLGEVSRDLTQTAMDAQLNPVVGRDHEIEGLIEVLGSFNQKNPVLVGERGAGKTAIVEGLAQRIADGDVPPFLADRRILAFDLRLLVGWTRDRQKLEERLNAIVKELMSSSEAIMFTDELQTLFGVGSVSGSMDVSEILRPVLLRGEIQCISASTPTDYRKSIQAVPWLGHCFRAVNVRPLDEEKVLLVLQGRKEQYEKFHKVTYIDESVKYAICYSAHYFPEGILLAKATETLDAAGSRVKLRQTILPEEVSECQKRLKFTAHRMEKAIADHEFEKARFYSEEEHKQRENLRGLREKYHLDDHTIGVVGREDIEDVVSRWTGVPIATIRKERSAEELISVECGHVSPSSPGTQKQSALRVFICHASEDKPAVRDLYVRLKQSQIDLWLDEENLLPGQEWDYEISKAVRSSHVVIVCLSAHSVNKAGYLQREIKKVLDVADEQPEGTIYVIPLKIEECDVPSRLRRWQWVNCFEANGFERLMHALLERAHAVGLTIQ